MGIFFMNKVTIEITRSCYKVYSFIYSRYNKEEGRVIGTSPSLDKAYSVFIRFKQFYTKKDLLELYDKKNKTFYIPIGADFKHITDCLDKDNVFYEIIDNSNSFIKPRDFSFKIDEKYQFRDQKQAESVAFLTSEKLFHNKMLALSTGTGKTFCAVIAAFKLKMPILLISETLSDQWIQKIIEYTNEDCTIENKAIKLIKGSANFVSMLNNKNACHAGFYITTSSTLASVVKTYGKEMLNNVCDFLGIGIKCFDEFHMHWKQNNLIDMSINTYMSWYLTATPSRTADEEKRLFYRTMVKVPSYGSKTFYERVDINLIQLNYRTNPTEDEYMKCFTSKGLSPVLYWNYIFNKFDRIMYMCGIIKMVLDDIHSRYPDAKILVYLAKLEHIEKFKRYFERMYDNLTFGNYTTDVERKRKRYEVRKSVIFTTIGSGGVGLDVENLQCLINFIPFSSQIIATQLIGRLRDIKDENGNKKDLYLYDCIDFAFPVMKEQRNKRMSIYRPRSKSIDSIRVTESDVQNILK